jgi:hypothetical protein
LATFVGRANVFRGDAARALCGSAPRGAIVVRPSDCDLPTAVCRVSCASAATRDRRHFFTVEADTGDRFEVLAEPDAAHVGDRVYVQAARAIAL